ncbi:DNA-directed RNA polymerases II, IV and V subunit 9B [Zancudomyces culisetae]|uniref:DNA-directed RNA polymerase II subunit RPB9 n=1 Tax=Zancudomyces culisetae TaxID=1213189 RepID=A0A1R1PSD4_ZANCU|nr:DNA-directed RNA polymerases II, IV and V subunit 9B [Zancudomyces culisetae]|eukprot:OMH83895.1 DNA-directed RNA polymerases II, IV and V subunit 9B [Zancudomyces culisetae]
MVFACRNCDYQEKATTNRVYRHVVSYVPSEQNTINADILSDSTLPRTNTLPCPKCGYEEVLYFQSQSLNPEAKMTLYYVCCNSNCMYKWTS